MKITKYTHSCLLIEESNTNILIDPGIYTYNEKVLSTASLQKLNYILITHSHADHMHIPFIKELVQKFPSVQIISNQEVVGLLFNEGIHATIEGNEFVATTLVQHEKIFEAEVPQNTLFTVFNVLTHPGDSLSLETTTDVLALPIQAPWGNTVWAVETAVKLKPGIIIPIHDWHWKDEVRKGMYERLATYFQEYGIEFKKIENGVPIEV